MFPSEFCAFITFSSGRFSSTARMSSRPMEATRCKQVSPRLSTMLTSAWRSSSSSTRSFFALEHAYWSAEWPCQFLLLIDAPWFNRCFTISMFPPRTARIRGVALVSSSRLMNRSKSPALIRCLPRYSNRRSRPLSTVQWSRERRF